tara:strand:- start:457 stop:810 length:354 start_codon:yes stop_codon:yes gene_type:complete
MPKLKNKSKQYLFKNKINLIRKSRKELIKESLFMILFGLFLLLVIYLIPQKTILFNSFKNNILDIFNNLFEIFFYTLEILIVLLICLALLSTIFLFIGSFNRFLKVVSPKSKKYKLR